MSRKLLIDAAHSEELRIVLLHNSKIADFDYQAAHKKSTKGNIYLAKVMRVEPSLQAAFVDYGNEKHGFLPFSEIHPDYYQIPVSDRERLIEEIKSELAQAADDDYEDGKNAITAYKKYKIQEVVKKDQVILVQIEKEERGSKGASLTTYISLAGRYCVLMPNATKDGGVSRKIDDDDDRKRLKGIAVELTEELKGKGAVIVRTAGAYKTKTEIKKDLQNLKKLWDNIVNHTVESKAPAFIHEEGDIIIKSIRDLYDSDLDEIIVDGEQAYEQAKDFMKSMLPRHVNKLKLNSDNIPLFAKYGLEEKLAALYSPIVALPSGGYLVINHTEALVAVDINSGKSTSERNIENTALKTNLEAAEEIANQIRLRDLSGLIVVDFIDMTELKNKKAVEHALKEAISYDKAKIHIGRISSFGLLEMSRQRLKHSLMESNTVPCPHCNSRGRIRPFSTTAVVILRALESEVAQARSDEVKVSATNDLVFYMLNQKRKEISLIEEKYKTLVSFYVDETAGGDGFYIEHVNAKGPKAKVAVALTTVDSSFSSQEPAKDEASEEVEATIDSSDEIDQEITLDQSDEIPSNQPRHKKDWKRRRFNKNGRNKRFKKSNFEEKQPMDDHQPHAEPQNPKMVMDDQRDGEEFDKEMAKRRKQNQNLLKEIWKKIVD
jgi:ribonuclease E